MRASRGRISIHVATGESSYILQLYFTVRRDKNTVPNRKLKPHRPLKSIGKQYLQAAVPVHLGEIKPEAAAALLHDHLVGFGWDLGSVAHTA